ncbi:hypothetical protein E2C01_012380 [Portunus trituberculatus]|uniref:Uncharacterized protein n=1 Tax=Portunus trituberculatus TaxID=210409 RepID=A0A5B7DEH5_PORTR|nr:hypothetical protein [Portunus trituberculatus]
MGKLWWCLRRRKGSDPAASTTTTTTSTTISTFRGALHPFHLVLPLESLPPRPGLSSAPSSVENTSGKFRHFLHRFCGRCSQGNSNNNNNNNNNNNKRVLHARVGVRQAWWWLSGRLSGLPSDCERGVPRQLPRLKRSFSSVGVALGGHRTLTASR